MNKIYLTLILGIVLSLSVYAQKYQIKLTFTGQLNAQHINLDSIQLKNITSSGDTLLIWPDTSLTFTFSGVGIPVYTVSTKMQVSLSGPLPGTAGNTVRLSLPCQGNTDLLLYDISGRLLEEYHHILNQGLHTFTILSGSKTINLLKIRWNGQQQTLKMANIAGGSSTHAIHYIGNEDVIISLKPSAPLNNFNFQPGDSIKITGFYGGNPSILFSAPSVSSDYVLAFGMNFACPGIASFTYGGQIYHTVQIGSQCWMQENLNIGTFVASAYQNTSHSECSNNEIFEKFCYLNMQSNCDLYGGLYDWNEMMQYTNTPGGQGICPSGWHIPTDSEFQTLANYLGGFLVAGGLMKEVGFTSWNPPNTGATNQSGFTALGAGYRYHLGNFGNIHNYENFWTSTEINAYQASFHYLMNTNAELTPYNYIKNYGFSVRCLKD